ncbi:hypothetical protein PPYR_07844 [Photinus pyralis]|uniref:Alpha-N-acetylglucosaminidase n=1 Tax=Photinus pyralis TaxID=7054 RepID=A0A5N4ARL3_PHOPY|nr:alpha-N-acetylglucosaminidase [Photinus pyralis]KAB0799964.1 hypothetical protein PPYR_07844 [Photinus pyralis]
MLHYVLLVTLFNVVDGRSTFSLVKTNVNDETQREAVENLIARLIPEHSHKFSVIINAKLAVDDKDVFKLERLSSGNVQITGSTGVAAASGFHHYLKYYCSCHVSWEASNLNLPSPLPNVNVTVNAQDRFRYYQNVCTASYSFAWWQWKDWEKHIDWMALNSYNLVLALTGVEAIWKKVYERLNLTEEEIKAHFPGPAFLAWGRMGNIRGWGGPLSDYWHGKSLQLQHKILDRMRSFGIVPVLPAFAGHVPRAIQRLFPNSKVTKTEQWNKFNDTYCCPYLLEPTDPLFQTIANMFMDELIQEFGTNHVYSCDTFNEMLPDNRDVSYLQKMGRAVYSGMSSSDANAIWVMQNWLFVHEITFWTPERAKALLTSVPQGKMLVLDLQSEQHPQYNRFHSYYGQPFIWCMLHDFGGTLGMFGSLYTINAEVSKARLQVNGTMVGSGITPEGINQNYILYDFMSEVSWRTEPTDLTIWVAKYALRRYGKENAMAIKSWQILKDTVYNFTSIIPMRGKYAITRRPSTRITTWIWYDPCDLLQAWKFLLQASQDLRTSSAYLTDLTDLTRQVLQVLGDQYYKKLKQHFRLKKRELFQQTATTFLDIFHDMENVLRSNEAFLLGKWLSAAKNFASLNGETLLEEEKLYEYNARNQITLWGPNGEINDYACKQWSGMVSDYYHERWFLFVTSMNESLVQNVPFREAAVVKRVFKEIEEPFTFSRKAYPEYASGDTVLIAQELMEKWWPKQHCRFERANDFNLRDIFEIRPTVIVVK